MNTNVQIRKAIEADLEVITEIINHEILNAAVLYEYEPRAVKQQTEWFTEKQQHRWPIIVAELNGCCRVRTYSLFRALPAFSKSIEHSVYTHQDHAEKAVDNLLMIELIRIAKSEGYHTMIAGIDSGNMSSIEFYRKFGFEVIGTFKEVGFKFDKESIPKSVSN